MLPLLAGLLALLPGAFAQAPTGDVFVQAEPGGTITIDGAATGVTSPGVVSGVAVGRHTLKVQNGCRIATAEVEVRPNAVERLEVTLAPGDGTVRVESTPHGASIREGNIVYGNAPTLLQLACGSHTLVAGFEGRDPTTRTVDVPAGGTVEVFFDLPPAATGALAITITPFDAQIVIDGQARGAGPMTVEGLLAGSHHLTARAHGYQVLEQDANVQAGQIVRLNVAMQPVPAPVPLSRRLGLDRVPWGRVGIDAGATAASAGLGVLGFLEYRQAQANYVTYTGLTYADAPDTFYQEEVRRPTVFAVALGAGSLLGLGGSALLWARTELDPPAPAMPVSPGTGVPVAPATPATPAAPAPPAPPAPAPGLQLHLSPTPGGLLLHGTF